MSSSNAHIPVVVDNLVTSRQTAGSFKASQINIDFQLTPERIADATVTQAKRKATALREKARAAVNALDTAINTARQQLNDLMTTEVVSFSRNIRHDTEHGIIVFSGGPGAEVSSDGVSTFVWSCQVSTVNIANTPTNEVTAVGEIICQSPFGVLRRAVNVRVQNEPDHPDSLGSRAVALHNNVVSLTEDRRKAKIALDDAQRAFDHIAINFREDVTAAIVQAALSHALGTNDDLKVFTDLDLGALLEGTPGAAVASQLALPAGE